MAWPVCPSHTTPSFFCIELELHSYWASYWAWDFCGLDGSRKNFIFWMFWCEAYHLTEHPAPLLNIAQHHCQILPNTIAKCDNPSSPCESIKHKFSPCMNFPTSLFLRVQLSHTHHQFARGIEDSKGNWLRKVKHFLHPQSLVRLVMAI